MYGEKKRTRRSKAKLKPRSKRGVCNRRQKGGEKKRISIYNNNTKNTKNSNNLDHHKIILSAVFHRKKIYYEFGHTS